MNSRDFQRIKQGSWKEESEKLDIREIEQELIEQHQRVKGLMHEEENEFNQGVLYQLEHTLNLLFNRS